MKKVYLLGAIIATYIIVGCNDKKSVPEIEFIDGSPKKSTHSLIRDETCQNLGARFIYLKEIDKYKEILQKRFGQNFYAFEQRQMVYSDRPIVSTVCHDPFKSGDDANITFIKDGSSEKFICKVVCVKNN